MSDSTTPQDDKAMSPASAGSQPVAWMVEWTDHAAFFLHKPDAEKVAAGDMAVQSLYRQPQPAITDEEREAVEVMERVANRTETLVVGIGPRHAKRFDGPTIAAALQRLLKRTK